MSLGLLASPEDVAALERRTNVIFVGCAFGLGATLVVNTVGPFGGLTAFSEPLPDDVLASPNGTLATALASRSMDITVWLVFYLMLVIGVTAAAMLCALGRDYVPARQLRSTLTDTALELDDQTRAEAASVLQAAHTLLALRRAAARIILRYAFGSTLVTLINGARRAPQVDSNQLLAEAYPIHVVFVMQALASRAMLTSLSHPTRASADLYGLYLPSISAIPWMLLPLLSSDVGLNQRARLGTAVIGPILLVLALLPSIRRLLRSSSRVIASALHLKLYDPEGPLTHLEQHALLHATRTMDIVCIACGLASQLIRGTGSILVLLTHGGTLPVYMQRVLNAVGLLVADGIAVPLLLLATAVHAHGGIYAARLHVAHARFAQARLRQQRGAMEQAYRRLRALLTPAALASGPPPEVSKARRRGDTPAVAGTAAAAVHSGRVGIRDGVAALAERAAGAAVGLRASRAGQAHPGASPVEAEPTTSPPTIATASAAAAGRAARNGALGNSPSFSSGTRDSSPSSALVMTAAVAESRTELDALELHEELLRNRLLPVHSPLWPAAVLRCAVEPCCAAASAAGVSLRAVVTHHCRPLPELHGPESVLRYAVSTLLLAAVNAATAGEAVLVTLRVVPVEHKPKRSRPAPAAATSASRSDGGGCGGGSGGSGVAPAQATTLVDGPPHLLHSPTGTVHDRGRYVLQLLVAHDWSETSGSPAAAALPPTPISLAASWSRPARGAAQLLQHYDPHAALQRCARVVGALGGAVGICEQAGRGRGEPRPLLWAELCVDDPFADRVTTSTPRVELCVALPGDDRRPWVPQVPAPDLRPLQGAAVFLASRDSRLGVALDALLRRWCGTELKHVAHHEALRTLLGTLRELPSDRAHLSTASADAVSCASSEFSEVVVPAGRASPASPNGPPAPALLLLLDADDPTMLACALTCMDAGAAPDDARPGRSGTRAPHRPRVAIVALSSDPTRHSPALHAAGCEHVVAKPVFPRHLLDVLASACGPPVPDGAVLERGAV